MCNRLRKCSNESVAKAASRVVDVWKSSLGNTATTPATAYASIGSQSPSASLGLSKENSTSLSVPQAITPLSSVTHSTSFPSPPILSSQISSGSDVSLRDCKQQCIIGTDHDLD